MIEMIERVALAISGGDDPASILSIHRSRARLAIEAMRDPTEKMKLAGDEMLPEHAGFEDDASGVYRAMIDAALN